MSDARIIICDENEDYLRLVQRYLIKKKLDSLKVYFFTDIEGVIEESKKEEIDVCLVNESFLEEKLDEIKTKKIIILKDKDTNFINSTYTYISKYQSMDKILERLIDDLPASLNNEYKKTATTIITFFETQKSKEALNGFNVSKHIADLGKRVLYLNFSPFTNYKQLTNTKGADVTDLIYYILKESRQLSQKVQLLKTEKNGVDFLLPVFDYEDLLELEALSWEKVMNQLSNLENYDIVVIELNAANKGLLTMYDKSVRFYIREEDQGKEAFEEFLTKKEKQLENKLCVYNSTDFNYWKGKLIEDGIITPERSL